MLRGTIGRFLADMGPFLAEQNSRESPETGFWNFLGPGKFQKPFSGIILEFVGLILDAIGSTLVIWVSIWTPGAAIW